MVQDPKQKPPPPPLPQQSRASNPPRITQPPSLPPKVETILSRPPLVAPGLMARLRSFLTPILRGSLLVDGNAQVLLNGARIGELRGNAFLLDYGPSFSYVQLPHSFRLVSEAKSMVIFFEITESSVKLCAGNTLGQKVLSVQLV